MTTDFFSRAAGGPIHVLGRVALAAAAAVLSTARATNICVAPDRGVTVSGAGTGSTGAAADANVDADADLDDGGAAATAAATPPGTPAAVTVGQTEDAKRVAAEIRFFQGQMSSDPTDFLTPTRLAHLHIGQARRTGDDDHYGRAEQALRTALERNPAHQSAVVASATVHTARHRFAEALAVARQAVEADPDDPAARGALGDALLETGDLEGAESEYERLAEMAPGLSASARLANLRQARGDAAGAAALMGRAFEAGEAGGAPAEDLAWCRVGAGRLAFRRGDWPAAEAHYLAAAKLAPGGYAAAEHLAELRAAQGRFDEAVSLYEQVVAAVPRPEFFHGLGDVLLAAGRPEPARAAHDKALRGYLHSAVGASRAHYFHHLAGFYADVMKDGPEAVKWAERDVELRRTVATLDTLAWAHHAAGQFAEAAKTMDEALALPGGAAAADAHVLYHASLIYFKVGNFPKAKDCLQRAAIANPKFREFHVHR